MVFKPIPISAIALFITICSLFYSSCNQTERSHECEDVAAEEITDECDKVEQSDTISEPEPPVEIEKKIRKPLTLIFTGLDPSKSQLSIVFYRDHHEFLSKTDRLKGYLFMSNGNKFTVQIEDLSYGEYAMAFYQDVNSNGECDRNFLGIPQEPYGFSNNFKPKLKAPRFEDCMFTYNEKKHTLKLTLIN